MSNCKAFSTGLGIAVIVASVTLGALSARSQAPASASPTFEVASVKPNKSGDGRIWFGMQPGGGSRPRMCRSGN